MDIIQEAYYNKIKNALFGCLCEREKHGDWEPRLDAILIELMGIPEEARTIHYYKIFYKLSSCKYLDFKYFRQTIFDVMALLTKEEK